MRDERGGAPRQGLRRLLTDEGGQAMVEYVIIVAFMIMALAAIFGAFPTVMRDYYSQTSLVLSLPIP